MEERVKMIPKALFEEIELQEEMLLFSHHHVLLRNKRNPGTTCDGISGLS
jgi:hypothetical protein